MRVRTTSCLIAAALLVTSGEAAALETFAGKVTVIEATYMPNAIKFYMDGGNASCPAGSVITWAQSIDNNKIVYATLLSALTSGKQVRIYMNDGDASCTARFVYVLQ
jgi:hypothetical protein